MGTSGVRFRHNPALMFASVIVAISGLSLWTWAPYLMILLVIPLAVAVWSWRSGTDADRSGLTVRATLGQRHIAWSEVTGLVVEGRQKVTAQLTSGRAITLPAVTAADVPKLVAASGQPIEAAR